MTSAKEGVESISRDPCAWNGKMRALTRRSRLVASLMSFGLYHLLVDGFSSPQWSAFQSDGQDTVSKKLSDRKCRLFRPSQRSLLPSPLSGTRCSATSQGAVQRGPSIMYLSSSSDEETSERESNVEHTKTEKKKLDVILSQLTSAFPIFVLGSAIGGFLVPSTLGWVNRGNLISLMLACVMMGTGMTLEKRDFTEVLAKNFASVPAGVLCQFCIMPATAFVVGRTMLLQADPILGPALFLGLALVGCSPGGTASNLVSLIAKADVALSVLLTSCSTILAAVVTPLLVKLLVGSTVRVSGMALCSTTARVVLMPVILGMILNAKAQGFSRYMSRFTPFASVLLVSLICGGVVSKNAASLAGASSTSLLPRIIGSVLSLHAIGFLAGYLVPRFGLGYSEKTARTISIETGMQNSALAVVLAQSIGAHPLAALPGALSATTHSCLGSILAAYWRFIDSRRGSNGKEWNESVKE